MKVKDVMHSGVTWADPNTPVIELAKMMRDDDIGAIPVGENDRLIGMVTDRDIVCRGLCDGADISTLTARDVMSGPILYCMTEHNIEDALRVMEARQVRRLPVINDGKRMVGMLALGDICGKAGRDLTCELVGTIAAHH